MTREEVLQKRQAEIAKLNDDYRMGTWNYLVTRGVSNLGNPLDLIEAVRRFAGFNEDNDPHGEHDFGSMQWRGEKVFWKIDYYDQNLEMWCEPLSDQCRRVITLMLAEEY